MNAIRRKPRLSLRFKAIIAIISLEFLLLSIFTYLSVGRHHQMMEEQMKENYLWFARTLTSSLKILLDNRQPEEIESLLTQTIKDKDVLYLVVRNSSGTVIASRRKQTPRSFTLNDSDLNFEGIDSVREIGEHPAGLLHQQGHIYEITKPIVSSTGIIGWLQLGIVTIRLNESVTSATYFGIEFLVAFFLLGAVVVALIDRKVKRTISHLVKITQDMAKGDFSKRVEISTGDDLEQLGNSYNKLADALKDRDTQIQRHERELENTVASRTKQLQDEKTKLKAVLDHVPSGFLLLDKNMQVLMASANFKEITGRDISDLIGNCCTLSIWNDELCQTCTTEQCLKTERLTTEMVKVEKSQGTVNYFEHNAIPIKKKGEIIYILEIITDITQRQLLQEQMIRAEKLSATGEMATVIAHEMRNSLTSVNMILQLMMKNAAKHDLDIESIQVALNSIQRTESVVNQLLQFSRPRVLQKHSTDLNRLIMECIEIVQPQYKRHGIGIKLRLDPKMPILEIDADKMREVIVNLLLNAEQAMDGDGRTKVTTNIRKLPAGLRDFSPHSLKSHHTAMSGNGYREISIEKGTLVIYIKVADTGKGIAPEQLERIFDPFFTTKANGTGLGLSVVKQIVNEHGGVVKVRSPIGKGSIFEIILPVNGNA
jgi:PAS domain S-box-containing protein